MQKRTKWLLLGIMLLTAFFRLYDIGGVPPGLYPDEAMNGNNALEALSTNDFKVFYPENNGREGLFINIQALSIAAFGNEPWALRGVSAIFGILTVLGVFLLARALLRDDDVALFAALFTALSFWHINFSRIGFRAIMAPFFLTWSMYFIWSESESPASNKRWLRLIAGGLLFGAGFNSYIAYRAAPALLLFPLYKLIRATREKVLDYGELILTSTVFLFCIALAAAPLGLYYLANPADFMGRTSQISIFTMESPLRELTVNIIKTVAMFFVSGDHNWRHNLSGAPELWWPVAILFLIGIYQSLRQISIQKILLLTWIAVMLLPVVISAEGIPHALRAILVIPPVMIIAALGMKKLIRQLADWLEDQRLSYPEYAGQLMRLQKELWILLAVFIIAFIANTFTTYFWRWGANIETYNAFAGDYVQKGYYLRSLPVDIQKFVIVNASGADVRGVPMPTQTIMYLTDSFTPEKQKAKNISYILPGNYSRIPCTDKCVFVLLEEDSQLRSHIKARYDGTLDTSPGFPVIKKSF
jgi:4-amino-4-deoxy-L-arabinose transferase-like glycosyltransferase